jgi:hypothetical protein
MGWARACDFFRRLLLNLALLESLQHDKESRNKDNRKASRGDHASENADPEGTARVGTGAGRKHEGQDAEDEGEGGHEDWPEPGARRVNRRFKDWLSINDSVLTRDFDDQNAILGRQGDQCRAI